MNLLKTLAMGLVLLGISSASMAFEEQKMQRGAAQPTQAAPAAGSTSLGITTPELSSKKDSGTKIRVPGLGIIGEIPKMDFGLELLYGANQPKPPLSIDRDSEASGVMGRVRVPLKSP